MQNIPTRLFRITQQFVDEYLCLLFTSFSSVAATIWLSSSFLHGPQRLLRGVGFPGTQIYETDRKSDDRIALSGEPLVGSQHKNPYLCPYTTRKDKQREENDQQGTHTTYPCT